MSEDDASAAMSLLDTPDLAEALDSDQFKQFLDHVPIAIAVAKLHPAEHIVYANLEFERLTGQSGSALIGCSWDALPGGATASDDGRRLVDAIAVSDDYIGAFTLDDDAGPATSIDAWSNVVLDDGGKPVFRLVALAEANPARIGVQGSLEQLIRDKDTLLLELQHRVKNNLQMITALIRLEARALPDHAAGTSFDRLAGRIEALALLYRALGENVAGDDCIDLGTYLSQIASAVMRVHAVEGVHLDLKVDSWPVSVNVAMPAGLVVNELMTNAIKHAFPGRSGTIRLECLVDDGGCRVVVADDGVGLPDGATWPVHGRLGAAIAQSLRQNAKARIEVVSNAETGTSVVILFDRADAAPVSA